jgi:mannose-6-phosphate isomerase-like protein (cupin superfamily)
MDFESNGQLQEVCNVKQPVLFEFKSVSPQFFEKMRVEYFLEKNGVQDVNVKDIDDYVKLTSVDSIVVPFQTAHSLLKSDPRSHLILDDNADFIEDCSHLTDYRALDTYLKPPMSVRTKYDFCMGSEKSYSPLKYHNHSRHYCIVSQGKIHVKMTPWKSSKYMNATHDYENYEFFSNINPWKNMESEKIKFVEFDVHEGDVLYVPPYWWYSYQYTSYDTIVCTATYNTPMNMVANAKHWALYFFQQQNIQQKTLKTLDTNNTTALSSETTDSSTDNDHKDNVVSDPDITAPLNVLHTTPMNTNT